MDADIVLDRGEVVAFRDVNPTAPTHILLIPREHIRDVSDITQAHGPLLGQIFSAARSLAASEGLREKGYRIVSNVGPDAGQSVFHLHFHLIGGRQMAWPPG